MKDNTDIDPVAVAQWGICSPEHLAEPDTRHASRFNKEKITTVMKWVSTVIMMAAAVAVVNDWRPGMIWLLNLGNLSWLITSILWGEASLIAVNTALMAVYAYGLVRTWI
jgi:hypothetical protein